MANRETLRRIEKIVVERVDEWGMKVGLRKTRPSEQYERQIERESGATASEGQGDKSRKDRKVGEEREKRGVASDSSGWISFRLVALMSLMRAARPLLPF